MACTRVITSPRDVCINHCLFATPHPCTRVRLLSPPPGRLAIVHRGVGTIILTWQASSHFAHKSGVDNRGIEIIPRGPVPVLSACHMRVGEWKLLGSCGKARKARVHRGAHNTPPLHSACRTGGRLAVRCCPSLQCLPPWSMLSTEAANAWQHTSQHMCHTFQQQAVRSGQEAG